MIMDCLLDLMEATHGYEAFMLLAGDAEELQAIEPYKQLIVDILLLSPTRQVTPCNLSPETAKDVINSFSNLTNMRVPGAPELYSSRKTPPSR